MSLSLEELEEGRRIAALVVKHYGEEFLPIFERFHNELERVETLDERVNLVLKSQRPTKRVSRRKNRK